MLAVQLQARFQHGSRAHPLAFHAHCCGQGYHKGACMFPAQPRSHQIQQGLSLTTQTQVGAGCWRKPLSGGLQRPAVLEGSGASMIDGETPSCLHQACTHMPSVRCLTRQSVSWLLWPRRQLIVGAAALLASWQQPSQAVRRPGKTLADFIFGNIVLEYCCRL
jgi:hypothetical protein